MPKVRQCIELGCGLEAVKGGRCEWHAKRKKRSEDGRRDRPRARGYDRKHEQDRARFLLAFPLCQWVDDDGEACFEESTTLDHIDGNPFNRSWTNYRALCKVHHDKRTALDQPGGWNVGKKKKKNAST